MGIAGGVDPVPSPVAGGGKNEGYHPPRVADSPGLRMVVLRKPAVIACPLPARAGRMVLDGDDAGKHLVVDAGLADYHPCQRDDVLNL